MKKSPGEKKERPIERPSSAVPTDVDGVSPASSCSEVDFLEKSPKGGSDE